MRRMLAVMLAGVLLGVGLGGEAALSATAEAPSVKPPVDNCYLLSCPKHTYCACDEYGGRCGCFPKGRPR